MFESVGHYSNMEPIHPACAPGLAAMVDRGQSLKQLAAHMGRSQGEVLDFLRVHAPETASKLQPGGAQRHGQSKALTAIRWMLVLPAAALAMLAILPISQFSATMTRLYTADDSALQDYVMLVASSAGQGALLVIAGTITAPSHRRLVGGALGLLCLLLAGFMIYLGVASGDWIRAVTGVSFGVAGVVTGYGFITKQT